MISPVGISQCLLSFGSFYFLWSGLFLVPFAVWRSPSRLMHKQSSFNRGSSIFFFFFPSPWITFSYFLYFFHPGITKEILPHYIRGPETHILNSFLSAHDTFLICPLQGLSGGPYEMCGSSWVKLSTAQWGLDIKSYVTQSILFYILPDLTLGDPLLSC